jgi:hypothetical protein
VGRQNCIGWLLALLLPTAGAQSPAPDAVIELWEQHWTLNADGSSVFHEKRHVRLNDERAYGEFADPRMTYNADNEKLDIIVARTLRPDGTYRELTDYAHVLVAPDAAAGKPAYAGLTQHLLVMGGVEPGCVVELEYRITRPPGARAYLGADVRLDHRYSVKLRKASVTVPAGTPLTARLQNAAADALTGDATKQSCELRDLPGVPDEPQAPPWQTRCPRFLFTTAGKASDWVRLRIGQLEAAAQPSELVKRLATEWTKDAKDPVAKLRALQEKLAASFGFVDFPVEWRPATPRSAGDVLDSDYGLPDEAAVALLSLARAAGLKALPGIIVNDDVWNHETPQEAMVAGYVVLLSPTGSERSDAATDDAAVVPSASDFTEAFEPRRGRVLRDRHWAGCTLLPIPDVLLQRAPLPKWSDADDSRCRVTGKLTLGEDGNLSGLLTLRVTGLFVNSEGLRTSDAQKSRLAGVLGHVVSDLNVESFAVKTLSPDEFEATAQVKSSKPLSKVAERYLVQLAQDGPFLSDVHVPLAHSRRTLPVVLAGAFSEDLDVTFEWPEKWQCEDVPAEVNSPVAERSESSAERSAAKGRVAVGPGGLLAQTTVLEKNTARVERRVRVPRPQLGADDFLLLRDAINNLRAESARTLLVKPEPSKTK